MTIQLIFLKWQKSIFSGTLKKFRNTFKHQSQHQRSVV